MKAIYCIYDLKAQSAVGGLLLFAADAAAIRNFTDLAQDEKTMLHRHLEDYNLLALGTFDDAVPCLSIKYFDAETQEGDAYRTVLTGASLKAAMTPSAPEKHTQLELDTSIPRSNR